MSGDGSGGSDPSDHENDVVRCMCGKDVDDGQLMVCCETCDTWQHGRCVGLRRSARVPDDYLCYQCKKDGRRRGGDGAGGAESGDGADLGSDSGDSDNEDSSGSDEELDKQRLEGAPADVRNLLAVNMRVPTSGMSREERKMHMIMEQFKRMEEQEARERKADSKKERRRAKREAKKRKRAAKEQARKRKRSTPSGDEGSGTPSAASKRRGHKTRTKGGDTPTTEAGSGPPRRTSTRGSSERTRRSDRTAQGAAVEEGEKGGGRGADAASDGPVARKRRRDSDAASGDSSRRSSRAQRTKGEPVAKTRQSPRLSSGAGEAVPRLHLDKSQRTRQTRSTGGESARAADKAAKAESKPNPAKSRREALARAQQAPPPKPKVDSVVQRARERARARAARPARSVAVPNLSYSERKRRAEEAAKNRAAMAAKTTAQKKDDGTDPESGVAEPAVADAADAKPTTVADTSEAVAAESGHGVIRDESEKPDTDRPDALQTEQLDGGQPAPTAAAHGVDAAAGAEGVAPLGSGVEDGGSEAEGTDAMGRRSRRSGRQRTTRKPVNIGSMADDSPMAAAPEPSPKETAPPRRRLRERTMELQPRQEQAQQSRTKRQPRMTDEQLVMASTVKLRRGASLAASIGGPEYWQPYRRPALKVVGSKPSAGSQEVQVYVSWPCPSRAAQTGVKRHILGRYSKDYELTTLEESIARMDKMGDRIEDVERDTFLRDSGVQQLLDVAAAIAGETAGAAEPTKDETDSGTPAEGDEPNNAAEAEAGWGLGLKKREVSGLHGAAEAGTQWREEFHAKLNKLPSLCQIRQQQLPLNWAAVEAEVTSSESDLGLEPLQNELQRATFAIAKAATGFA